MAHAAKAEGFFTAADLNAVPAGTTFTATWRFRNLGTTTWGPGYTFRYVTEGHAFNAPYTKDNLGVTAPLEWTNVANKDRVAPGEVVDCTVTLRMPEEPGVYVAHWRLYAPDGTPFGSLRYVRIGVTSNADLFDYFQFVSFSSSHDLSALPADTSFTVTWQVRNVGSRTWRPDYRLEHGGEPAEENEGIPEASFAPVSSYPLVEVADMPAVSPGQSVGLTLKMSAPTAPGTYASHWQLTNAAGVPFGGVLWVRLQVIPSSQPQPRLQTGMNINPDQVVSNPVESDELLGCRWVRFPFRIASRQRTLEAAFAQIDPIVDAYAVRGIASLLVINQETVWGENAPWAVGTSDWSAYIAELAATAAAVAAHYAHYGQLVAIQLWNEGDNPATPWVSIYVPPLAYAHMLRTVVNAVHAHAPTMRVLAMGLSTGPANAVRYLSEVYAALEGKWPVDALAVHPYGRWFEKRPFPGWGFGTLDEVFDLFQEAFPEMPLWVTEIGVPGGAQPINGEANWHAIGAYMRDVFANVEERYAVRVPVVIWFAWSDLMENAGVVQADGRTKPGLYDAFVAVRDGKYTIV